MDIKCPHCHKHLEGASEDHIGLSAVCPACGKEFIIDNSEAKSSEEKPVDAFTRQSSTPSDASFHSQRRAIREKWHQERNEQPQTERPLPKNGELWHNGSEPSGIQIFMSLLGWLAIISFILLLWASTSVKEPIERLFYFAGAGASLGSGCTFLAIAKILDYLRIIADNSRKR